MKNNNNSELKILFIVQKFLQFKLYILSHWAVCCTQYILNIIKNFF
jgi:hypothetical protein